MIYLDPAKAYEMVQFDLRRVIGKLGIKQTERSPEFVRIFRSPKFSLSKGYKILKTEYETAYDFLEHETKRFLKPFEAELTLRKWSDDYETIGWFELWMVPEIIDYQI